VLREPTPPQAAVAPAPSPPTAARPASPHQEFRDCDKCPVMVALPAGTFEMGSSADASERPIHRVAIAAFAIGKFEVTQGEWSACVTSGGCTYKPHGLARAPTGCR
jgi:formylglycine-generating enzyme required for sulfatase activity